MERAFLETIFLCGVALLALLELYYLQNCDADRKILIEQRKKRTFLLLLIVGLQVIPFIYIFTVDFGPTDYHFWKWLGFPVTLCFAFFVWLFVKALIDLGIWWTPGQELKEDLQLVKTGAYHYVRHPMYLALLGIAVCQVFMIQNWIAGPISLLLVTPFVIYQIGREERLLTKYFGDDYREYIINTGMLWPREEKMPLFKKIIRELIKNTRIFFGILWKLIVKLYKKRPARSMNRSL
ncbi:MAG: isoprenylcysteine carboxylmethyltransferase family protein [Prolixibacteraceae bacterium]|jgi:protein-S-isoprenylcysteine O-methyltransferase Ste14|nr:isoprenylcysteine carboxylmethyltransferase family protein [Prolixibacteraceae bacterium]